MVGKGHRVGGLRGNMVVVGHWGCSEVYQWRNKENGLGWEAIGIKEVWVVVLMCRGLTVMLYSLQN